MYNFWLQEFIQKQTHINKWKLFYNSMNVLYLCEDVMQINRLKHHMFVGTCSLFNWFILEILSFWLIEQLRVIIKTFIIKMLYWLYPKLSNKTTKVLRLFVLLKTLFQLGIIFMAFSSIMTSRDISVMTLSSISIITSLERKKTSLGKFKRLRS